jgi:hypothetical protein
MSTNTIALSPTLRAGTDDRQERPFLEFVVDGVPLLSLLGPGDFTSVLSFSTEALEASARCLLLRAPSALPSGRIPLYVCPECGDLACGTLCASITLAEGHFIWSSFAYEKLNAPEALDVNTYSAVGPFHFPAESYVSVLAAAGFRDRSA